MPTRIEASVEKRVRGSEESVHETLFIEERALFRQCAYGRAGLMLRAHRAYDVM